MDSEAEIALAPVTEADRPTLEAYGAVGFVPIGRYGIVLFRG